MPEIESRNASTVVKADRYEEVRRNIAALLEGESDWVAAMSTVVCELHNSFDYYNWTGFYRNVDGELVIGPYQGSHGCLRIAFGRGVCGTAAAERKTQVVPDVDEFPGHIACSSTTRSEIVVPVVRDDGSVLAVLDVDSDTYNSFDVVDLKNLEALCNALAKQFGSD